MEVLDTSIANVALPHIAGSLGASQEEATWVLTSYLVSERDRAADFGVALKPDRPEEVLHVVRGAVYDLLAAVRTGADAAVSDHRAHPAGYRRRRAGAESEQAILADTFPVAKRGQAFALYGMAVVVAPAIGPTLGGWITDNFNWHWIFFINLPIGLVSLYLEQQAGGRSAEHQGAPKKRRSCSDRLYLGLALVALGGWVPGVLRSTRARKRTGSGRLMIQCDSRRSRRWRCWSRLCGGSGGIRTRSWT